MNENDNDLITKEELARRLKVTQSAVNKWMAKRRLPYIKLGRRCVRFRWADVLKSLEVRTIPARLTLSDKRNKQS